MSYDSGLGGTVGGQPPPAQPPPTQPGSFGPAGPAPQPSLSQADERLWATLAHLAVPFFGFVVPLIIWLVFKDRGGAWLAESMREALNFSILYSIAMVVSGLLLVTMIGLLLIPLVGIAALIFCILGAMATNRGEPYRYPVNLRFVQ